MMPGFYCWPDYPESYSMIRVEQLPLEERRRCKHEWIPQARWEIYDLSQVCRLCGALECMV